MNELHAEYDSKGLTIIGVTNESESQTEPWIKSKEVAYAYAYDKGGKLSRTLGVSGIPHAFLVSPAGKIVWEGHPASLDNKIIEDNLADVITKPLYEWSGKAGKIKKAFLDNDFAGALESAAKLGEDDPFGVEIGAVVQGILTARVAKLNAALEMGDVLTAYDTAKSLSKGLKGLPEAEAVKEALKRISKDKQLTDWLKTQGKLRDIVAIEVLKKKEADDRISDLEKLLKGNEGSFAGDAIEAKISELRKLRGQLR